MNPETRPRCKLCENKEDLGFSISMAFQPIIDYKEKSVFAYEALVRGTDGSPAYKILEKVNEENIYQFDQKCRTTAIQLASKLDIKSNLSINFIPGAVYKPETCIRQTLEAAHKYNFPTNKIIFEVIESEKVRDRKHLLSIFQSYAALGFRMALDDFGEGFSGLNHLLELDPNIIKIDIKLIRDIDKNNKAKLIVKNIKNLCDDLNIAVVAEGVETVDELRVLLDLKINLFQGYIFAKPKFEGLPDINYLSIE
ncbi:EAL domain-containing protein [Candidatus Igneacidithiobacillus taiwanensis]|uniref:EAL domain-containing protein n=1 Tax=Candidatus Igneacidithiobacillus taiwanensis TaxID=1945924 RepID=UPI0028A2635E|nr:EAL domain-containing protein [Candidatus Igneacidithiobacillus taiwanensis]